LLALLSHFIRVVKILQNIKAKSKLLHPLIENLILFAYWQLERLEIKNFSLSAHGKALSALASLLV